MEPSEMKISDPQFGECLRLGIDVILSNIDTNEHCTLKHFEDMVDFQYKAIQTLTVPESCIVKFTYMCIEFGNYLTKCGSPKKVHDLIEELHATYPQYSTAIPLTGREEARKTFEGVETLCSALTFWKDFVTVTVDKGGVPKKQSNTGAWSPVFPGANAEPVNNYRPEDSFQTSSAFKTTHPFSSITQLSYYFFIIPSKLQINKLYRTLNPTHPETKDNPASQQDHTAVNDEILKQQQLCTQPQNQVVFQSSFNRSLSQGFVHGFLEGLFAADTSPEYAALAAEGATAAMIAAVSLPAAAVYIASKHMPLGPLTPYRNHISLGISQISQSASLFFKPVQTMLATTGAALGSYAGEKAGHCAGQQTSKLLTH